MFKHGKIRQLIKPLPAVVYLERKVFSRDVFISDIHILIMRALFVGKQATNRDKYDIVEGHPAHTKTVKPMLIKTLTVLPLYRQHNRQKSQS